MLKTRPHPVWRRGGGKALEMIDMHGGDLFSGRKNCMQAGERSFTLLV
ncbi:hypothetical protein ACNKHU_20160 [Shigella flexneri]